MARTDVFKQQRGHRHGRGGITRGSEDHQDGQRRTHNKTTDEIKKVPSPSANTMGRDKMAGRQLARRYRQAESRTICLSSRLRQLSSGVFVGPVALKLVVLVCYEHNTSSSLSEKCQCLCFQHSPGCYRCRRTRKRGPLCGPPAYSPSQCWCQEDLRVSINGYKTKHAFLLRSRCYCKLH